ncbi:TetR/AcrR family transcriptional regulator [Microbacterium invictum]|uniref:TetR/AcrR family transcriptional regulator n=1 Tax=Microbacterium invictum TaxID=515415 RepID=A0ABZ0VAR5_9MICO|nr:TetR/AcrR family transcriptional regulator [Microbacterium invictum]WQB70721.1 TetR/AcrR family transcriptional regulator [Microbacterium invictum]
MPTALSKPVARRADAVRNVERILDASIVCLQRRPSATMAEIAEEAGLGRVTLYGHFASRPALIDAVVSRVLAQGEEMLAAVDLKGDPRTALAQLIRNSWQLVDQSRSIISAAEAELSPARIRQLHDGPAARVEALVERGRADGQFRKDMPTSWLVAVLHQILHGAGGEVASGRLDPADAPERIIDTVLSVLDAR